MSIEYSIYSEALLPGLVEFWNRSFQDRRNFYPVSESILRERVIEKKTAVEQFDPSGYIVARSQETVLGVVHVGVRPEELCTALYPDWPGGRQGYYAFIYVGPDERKQGIGSELWRRGREAMGDVVQVALDGQCINPFYGNSEGPFTPLWGTPEGISVSWKDSGAKKFFARHGYAPRYKAEQLELVLKHADFSAPVPDGFEIKLTNDFYPEVGVTHGISPRYTEGGPFECAAALSQGKTVAVLSYFPLSEVGPGRYAIYEAVVQEDYQGKGLGKALLTFAIQRMKKLGASKCDVLTLPEISSVAYALYVAAGFTPCASWAIY